MFALLFKTQVLQTGDSRLAALCMAKFKEDNIPYTIQLDDLNHQGGFNDVSIIKPHTAYKEIQTVYVSEKYKERALHIVQEIKRKREE
ncbi:MAG: hypothetical protein LKF53_03615 [Solobacterium sp.]|nr:hypothetical protein [Solobacterium sp.]MCH4205468.1 hypothetical protein [Solobacterium sp.]MCH4226992.1 hypothetical protein [Solobacterium sp.]MCH4282155.1 hypothetical protein [Solobacterium sp.]